MVTSLCHGFIALATLVLQAAGYPSSSLPFALSRGVPNSSAPTSPFPPRSGFNAAARAAGKLYFGTATNNYQLNDTAYVAILDDLAMFGQLTPAKAMKWVHMS